MRVCHLTSVHSATDVRIFEKEARSLAAAGYEVTVVGRHPQDEERDGVQILAVQPPRSRLRRMLFFTWKVMRRGLSTNAKIYHFHDPELMPVGVVFRMLGKKVICDVHEYLPEDVLHKKDYIPRPLRLAISVTMRGALRFFALFYNAIVTVTPAIAARFPARKTYLVQNYPILSEALRNLPTRTFSGQPKVLFTGGISRIRSSQQMVDAMALLQDLNARLIVAGPNLSPEIMPAIEVSAGRPFTEFLGQVGREEVVQLLLDCDVGLLLLHMDMAYKEFSSNKLYEYLLAGLPIVVADIPAWRWTGEADCAILVDPLDANSIANGIRTLLENPEDAIRLGAQGRKQALEKYNWDQEAQTLLKAYEAMA